MDADKFLRMFLGGSQDKPTRNDCGSPDRFDCEDASRMHGWGIEGEGFCDYPKQCGWWREGRCPLAELENK